MRIGVPLVAGTDPVPLALLDRLVAQANAELALASDPRRLSIVRLAAEPAPVRLWGGARVIPDALFRDAPGLDVLVAVGPATADGAPAADEEAVVAYLRRARGDVQHVIAVGEGVRWALEAGLCTGRRAVLNHLAPAVRSRFDATLPAHSDPAHDGDLWTATDPPRFILLLLEFFADIGGFTLPDRVQMHLPWIGLIRRALSPVARPGPADDDEGGIPAVQDVGP